MNCFLLHQLDTKLKEGMYTAGQKTRLFYYARYADDMLIGIPDTWLALWDSMERVTFLRET